MYIHDPADATRHRAQPSTLADMHSMLIEPVQAVDQWTGNFLPIAPQSCNPYPAHPRNMHEYLTSLPSADKVK
eukprot:6151300-Karenia_brevis.AAC.1